MGLKSAVALMTSRRAVSKRIAPPESRLRLLQTVRCHLEKLSPRRDRLLDILPAQKAKVSAGVRGAQWRRCLTRFGPPRRDAVHAPGTPKTRLLKAPRSCFSHFAAATVRVPSLWLPYYQRTHKRKKTHQKYYKSSR